MSCVHGKLSEEFNGNNYLNRIYGKVRLLISPKLAQDFALCKLQLFNANWNFFMEL